MNSRGSLLRLAAGLTYWLAGLALAAEPVYRAAVWQADVPGGDPDFVQLVAEQVKGAGYDVEFLDSVALTNTATLHTNRFDLLALPNARILPVESAAAIEGFLQQGGDLLALGLPGWEEPRFRLGGRWLSREAYEQTLTAVRPRTRLVNFAPGEAARWKRHTNDPQSPAHREVVSDADGLALHVLIENLTSWDIVEPPSLAGKFAPGETLTCFRAKGGPRTPQLALEWIEADGSRWIASVNLTTNWQHYALPPEAFKAWEPKGGRGGPGDRLNVTNVARFTAGVALSHNAVELGPHEFWLADLGPAANPFGEVAPPVNPRIPRLESFSPGYMVFPVNRPVIIDSHELVASFTHFEGLLWNQGELLAFHPRPGGAGFGQGRPWRWSPSVVANDPQSKKRLCVIGVMLIHWQPPHTGGIWALMTPWNGDFYRSAQVKSWIGQMVSNMRRGLFLVEGGADTFACTASPPTSDRKHEHLVGATVVNWGKKPTGKMSLCVQGGSFEAAGGGAAHPISWEVNLDPGKTITRSGRAQAYYPREVIHKAAACLSQGSDVWQFLGHDISLVKPRGQGSFIQARDGGFWLDGKPWKAHGVNYMPSSGIGIASDYFEHWLDRGAYDPVVVQSDLRQIKDMGLNAVSIFIYHRSVGSGHLLDFLWRCEHLGLKVNLSLRPGTPMDFRWAEMKEIIEHYRLAENDTVFAYDLAWEPSHFDENHQRKHYTQPWNAWVLKRYGSAAAAQTAWGADTPDATWWRDIASAEAQSGGAAGGNSAIRIPRSEFLTRDGSWRAMVADYRLFLDELLAEKYAEARRLVKSIDPNHPVSFRMQFAGDPTFNQPSLLPYDLYGLRDAVDIWEPEAYGRIGAWAQVRGGLFTAAYARLCDPAKPVMWAEMGFDCWDRQRMAPSPQKLEFTARYYADFYRMLIESGADGVFFWWYAGGYRLNEQSDYGIINPDGTDRPVTKVIRDWGAKFLAAPKPPAPKRWIGVNRDLDARGLPGIYDAVQAEYWRAIESGENVGLKWDRPPGGKP